MRHRIRFLTTFLGLLLALSTSIYAQGASDGFDAGTGEAYRPAYHVTAPQNWMGPPNDVVYVDGQYHLFYLHNPAVKFPDASFWKHAVSDDLVNWDHQPVMLFPNANGGINAGSVVLDQDNTAGFGENTLIALFTYDARRAEDLSLAISTDNGSTWSLYDENPVLEMPDDLTGGIFRHPRVFWHNDHWVMTVATGLAVRFYRSDNLLNWEVSGEFLKEEVSDAIWERADLFPVPIADSDASGWVLSVSVTEGAPAGEGPGVKAFVGDFDDGAFTPSQDAQWVENSVDFHAPVSWATPDGRRLWWGWMTNSDYAAITPEARFRGMLSLPRELSLIDLNGTFTLVQQPAREMQSLRTESWAWEDVTLSPDGTNPLADISGDAFEIIAEFDMNDATAERFGFRVRQGEDQATAITYLPQTAPIDDISIFTIENPGFDTGDLTGWTPIGPAFAEGDLSTATDWGWGCCFNNRGEFHLWGYQDGGDGQTGELRSETFILGGTGEIDFLIGGGNNPDDLFVSLNRSSDNEELIRTTNIYWQDTEGYTRHFWSLPEYIGEEVYIRVVDNAVGGWGHINVDDFNVYSPRDVMVIDRTQSGDSSFEPGFANKYSVQMLPEDNTIRLHIFVDRSSVEAFGNGGVHVLSQRMFPDSDSLGLELFALDGEVTLRSLDVYRLDSTTNAPTLPQLVDVSAGELINGGFEAGDLRGWTTLGRAFDDTHVIDLDCYGNCRPEDVYGDREGGYHVGGRIENISGLLTGTLRSNVFTLDPTGDGQVEFLISGGNDRDRIYVALVRASDGKTLYRATGDGTNAFRRITWDASQYTGTPLYFEVVDYATNLLGYLNVDDFRIANTQGIAARPGQWSFDATSGATADDAISGISDEVHYVFNDARYIADSDPMWRDGVVDNALLFDGYSTWIERPADDFMLPVDQLTISAWVAPRSYEWGDMGQVSAIVNQHDPVEGTGFILGMGRHGSVSWQVSVSGTWYELETQPNVLPSHTWSHLVAVVDADAGFMRLYRNGEMIAEQAIVGGAVITPSEAPLMIGRHNTAARVNGVFRANMFNGLIDELRVSNSVMTEEDVLAEFQSVLADNDGEVPFADTLPDRSRFDGDPHRPQYHMMPAEHWMNEPHGLMEYEGVYHIFFQQNPQGPYWHQIHWGHQYSDDLVQWIELLPAVPPQANSVAPDGVWSGSAMVDADGNPLLFITAGNDSRQPNQAVGLATSTSGENPLAEWELYPELLIDQETDLDTPVGQVWGGQFRDPHIWKETAPDGEPIWFMLVGSGILNTEPNTVPIGGTGLTYSSRDLYEWEYRGPAFIGDYQAHLPTGAVWELPVVLPLGEDTSGQRKHIFLINPWFDGYSEYGVRFVFYWIGSWDVESARFIPDHDAPRMFDYGEHFTGPSGTVDSQGRSILFSIAQDRRSEDEHYAAGWAHNAGLPLLLSLNDDDTLRIEPVPEIANLRNEQLVDIVDATLVDANAALADVNGDMLEIVLEIDLQNAEAFGLYVRQSADRSEETLLSYDLDDAWFSVNRDRSSLDPDARKGVHGGPLSLEDGVLSLRVFLDRSMVEAYANDRRSITTRVYPTLPDATGLSLLADGDITIRRLTVYSMNGAYGDVAPAIYGEPAPLAGQLQNHSFQTCDLSGWEVVEGDAFTSGHVTFVDDWEWGGPFYQADDGNGCHLWGGNPAHGGDALTGVIRSQPFTLGGDGQIDFLIAGGDDPETVYVALVDPETEAILMQATGHDHEQYRRVFWNASDYIGQTVVIEIVDNNDGAWGHLNVDDINVPTDGPADDSPTVYRP